MEGMRTINKERIIQADITARNEKRHVEICVKRFKKEEKG